MTKADHNNTNKVERSSKRLLSRVSFVDQNKTRKVRRQKTKADENKENNNTPNDVVTNSSSVVEKRVRKDRVEKNTVVTNIDSFVPQPNFSSTLDTIFEEDSPPTNYSTGLEGYVDFDLMVEAENTLTQEALAFIASEEFFENTMTIIFFVFLGLFNS